MNTPTKKLAIFVEGTTETLFVEKLINEIAQKNSVVIEVEERYGGSKRSGLPLRTIKLRKNDIVDEKKYYVLIVNCRGDNQVKIRISDEHESLTNNGYTEIIGLRDVYPDYKIDNVNILRHRLPLGIKPSLSPVTFVLAVMEIEAWFLAETTHFSKVDPSLTTEMIQSHLGFNPSIDDMQRRPAPAKDLIQCYNLVNQCYEKGTTQKTIDNLDFTKIYCDTANLFEDLRTLIERIDVFLSAPSSPP